MRRNKIAFLLIICCVSIGSLRGCSEYNNNNKEVINEIQNNESYDGGENFKKKLNSSVTIDAKVSFPQEKNINTYIVKRKVFDKDKIKELFLGNKSIEASNVADGDVNITSYSDVDKSLTLQDGMITYESDISNYAYEIFNYAMQSDSNSFNEGNLKFMNKEEVIRNAIKYCKDLGLEVDESKINIKALSLDKLKEQELKLKQSDDSFKYYIEIGKIKSKELIEDDEAYVLNLGTMMNNIPVLSRDIILQTSDYEILGTGIQIIISKEGIKGFYVNGAIYEKENESEENVSIISVDEATKSVGEKYSEIVSGDNFNVKEICLEYVPTIISKNNEYKLVPAWCFKGNIETSYTKEDQKINETYENSIYINAVTGKEII